MRARIWVPLMVVGLVIVGFFALRSGAQPPQVEERTASVERGPIEVFVTGTGSVEPAALARLSFRVTGTLSELEVEVGQQVREGQVLARLDPDSLDANLLGAAADLISAQQALNDLLEGASEQQLAQAEQALAQARDALHDAEYHWSVQQEGNRASSTTIRGAEARLVLAEEELAQAKDNYDQYSGHSSDDPARAVALTQLAAAQADRDSALRNLNWYTGHPTEIQQGILDADVAVAAANLTQAEQDLADLQAGPEADEVEKAEARVRSAQAVVDQSRLIAPIEGTVMSINHLPGDSISPSEVEIVLADLTVLHVDTTIDELDIALIEIGQQVEITLDALPDLLLEGKVISIDLSPRQGEGGTQYPVRVELAAEGSQVRIGMTAALSISVSQESNAVLVPNWALGFDSETGEITVTVHNGLERERRVVELGLRNDSFSQVVSGLEAGETVGVAIDQGPSGPPGGFFGGG